MVAGVDNLRILDNLIGGKRFESAAANKKALILNTDILFLSTLRVGSPSTKALRVSTHAISTCVYGTAGTDPYVVFPEQSSI